jgi:hypothetical protein
MLLSLRRDQAGYLTFVDTAQQFEARDSDLKRGQLPQKPRLDLYSVP